MAWLLAEDDALKTQLSGLTVRASNNTPRPVKVYFRFPEDERVSVTWPIIVIDNLGVHIDSSREHRGRWVPKYIVDEAPAVAFDAGRSKVTELPIPAVIMYQISTFALNFTHDRALTSALHSTGKIPLRFGQLYVPEDNTYRRMDRVGDMYSADQQVGRDRIFRKVYTVSVTSELNPSDFFDRYLVQNNPTIDIRFFWPEELVIPLDD